MATAETRRFVDLVVFGVSLNFGADVNVAFTVATHALTLAYRRKPRASRMQGLALEIVHERLDQQIAYKVLERRLPGACDARVCFAVGQLQAECRP